MASLGLNELIQENAFENVVNQMMVILSMALLLIWFNLNDSNG